MLILNFYLKIAHFVNNKKNAYRFFSDKKLN